MTRSTDHEARLAKALRENLKRRKKGARADATGLSKDEGVHAGEERPESKLSGPNPARKPA